MSRIPQQKGKRGSLKWIQAAIENAPELIQPKTIETVHWLSPLSGDDYAEYRDEAFLSCVGLDHLSDELKAFWPSRGPQWDALGKAGDTIILVEAKAHVREFYSPGTQAGPASKALIENSLAKAKTALGAQDLSDWSQLFYQYTNRIAHLNWLIDNGVSACLLFVSFVKDDDMKGPGTAEAWKAVFQTADHALGIPTYHKLSKYILHVYPDVTKISD